MNYKSFSFLFPKSTTTMTVMLLLVTNAMYAGVMFVPPCM